MPKAKKSVKSKKFSRAEEKEAGNLLHRQLSAEQLREDSNDSDDEEETFNKSEAAAQVTANLKHDNGAISNIGSKTHNKKSKSKKKGNNINSNGNTNNNDSDGDCNSGINDVDNMKAEGQENEQENLLYQQQPQYQDADQNKIEEAEKPKSNFSAEELEELNRRQKMKGVVYISRLPPHLKPLKLRHLLQKYGAIGRVYCQPEDPKIKKIRKKMGGHKKTLFTEGWVEFEDKRIAKRVAEALNGNPMEPKKRDFFSNDLWTIKYLPKFKWHHLTERMAYEAAVREQTLRNEMSQVRRETDYFVEQVSRSKATAAMAKRRNQTSDNNARPFDNVQLPKQREAL